MKRQLTLFQLIEATRIEGIPTGYAHPIDHSDIPDVDLSDEGRFFKYYILKQPPRVGHVLAVPGKLNHLIDYVQVTFKDIAIHCGSPQMALHLIRTMLHRTGELSHLILYGSISLSFYEELLSAWLKYQREQESDHSMIGYVTTVLDSHDDQWKGCCRALFPSLSVIP